MDGALALALPAARFVHDAALTLLFGGLLFPIYALGEERRDVPAGMRGWLRALAWLAALFAPVVFLLGLAGMAGSLAAALDPGLILSTATQGEFGWLFLARFALLLLAAVLLTLRRGEGVALWLSGAALAALALTGHAREGAGAAMLTHVALDALHLLSAGLWLGALPWFGVVLGAAFPPQEALAAVRRFSSVAAVAVAVLFLSGAGATLLLVGSPLALLSTAWGQLLIAKVILAAVMTALAAHNRWRLTPGLESGEEAAAALRRNARLELALGLVVLAIVGWLGTLPYDGG